MSIITWSNLVNCLQYNQPESQAVIVDTLNSLRLTIQDVVVERPVEVYLQQVLLTGLEATSAWYDKWYAMGRQNLEEGQNDNLGVLVGRIQRQAWALVQWL
jgi:hypothetical protein